MAKGKKHTNALIFKNMNRHSISVAFVATALLSFSISTSSTAYCGKDSAVLEKAVMTPDNTTMAAQSDPNAAGDNIIGNYLVEHKGEKSKVKVYKNSDGSYTAQVFWVQNRTEKDGSVRKDAKNPDKSLRNVDCDKIVLFKGLKYDAAAKVWSGTNIYDPVRGINASLKAWFSDTKTLSLKGSKMGFSETVTWTKL